MSVANTNGRMRKSLAEQIDRLDQILDGLAEGLNEAVATAVKEAVAVAVQEAVRGILTELLTNPEVLAKLKAKVNGTETAGPAPNAQPTSQMPQATIRQRLSSAWGWIGKQLKTARHSTSTLIRQGLQACGILFCRLYKGAVAFWGSVQIVRHFKVQMLTALAVGAGAGVAAYFAGPWLAATVGGFATALSVQAAMWVKRVVSSPVVTSS